MPAYGNVPNDDIGAMKSAVAIAARVAGLVPAFAPPRWRDVAYEGVLNGILEDWVANGTNALDDGDEQDLADLMRLSADIALAVEEPLRDTTFHLLLRNAMKDWVENWNAEE